MARRGARLFVGVKTRVTMLLAAAAAIPGELASQGRACTSTLSPGEANGRLVAPSVELKVFSACGITSQAACTASGVAPPRHIATRQTAAAASRDPNFIVPPQM